MSRSSDGQPGNPTHIPHYEQLLSIQQDQHALAMERKEAEIAHLKVRLAALEGHLTPQDAVNTAVQTKDEECALMMAAKHKELELLATLLQMREQQIEELRSQCEESQVQLAHLRSGGSGSCRASPGSATPPGSHLPGTTGRLDETRREVQRLRLRMEELEASVTEQQDRCTLLARELQIKSERVEVLEDQIQALQWQDGSAFHQRGPRNEGAAQETLVNDSAGDLRGPSTGPRSASPALQHAESAWESFRLADSPGRELRVTPSPYSEDDCISESGPRLECPEPPSTGRQSQELLREMRRLRQQMTELEKLAAGRDQGLPTADKLGAMSSLSMSSGSRQSAANSHTQGIMASGVTDTGDRPGSSLQGALAAACLGASLPEEDGVLSAWEYRPHENDLVDSAVARLVNRGRYRAWRALLCRLEHGVYLCGTKRVHIRVDEEQEVLEASKDGGRTWTDLTRMVT
ncbi:unnamed protein product [Symbiodinium natans]|uniref:Uncharacterized protein n=1 Tax=Symbiodinium natans TaxID=878477 RepID=A0A812PG72_9DINO|nr:unnamed protein product [Symbiodinium natans]